MPAFNILVVKIGLARDLRGSNIVLIIFAVLCTLAAVGIYAHYVVGWNPFVKQQLVNQEEIQRLIRQDLDQATK